MAKKKTPNTGYRNGNLFCFNCGASQSMPFPMSVNEMVAITTRFDKEHKACEPMWKEPVNENAANQTEGENIVWWLQHGEQGQSAMTMLRFLTTAPNAHLVDLSRPQTVPRDPDDFKRCERLLLAVPQFRNRLAQMNEAGPVWKNLVDNWDALVVLLNQQLAGKKNSMYEFMQTLGC